MAEGLLAAFVAGPQPSGLQHLGAYEAGGLGRVPHEYRGAEGKNRREMRGDGRGLHSAGLRVRRRVQAVIDADGAYFE